jgi:1-acyl-sn-glycerol-3-phosphate acyltransferase
MLMTLPKPIRALISGWGMIWLTLLTIVFGCATIVLAWCRVSQHKIQWAPRKWASLILWGVGCPVRTLGRENIDPNDTYVFASNHTSALDIPTLLGQLPSNFRWIAKKELFKIALFGPAMLRAGYIPIDRSDGRAALESLNRAAERIAGGASVVIFPEGTRSADGQLLPFKSGGLALAIRSKRPVVPVAIIGANKVLKPKSLLIAPGRICLVLGKPIPTEGLKMGQRDELAQKVREQVQALLDTNTPTLG